MCGIVGAISKQRMQESDIEDVLAMNRLIMHRGPDNADYYHSDRFSCGSSRLAIIDLNMRSNQPMLDKNGRYILVFNGEVYNYEEIRKELQAQGHRFKTTSDTEVVLKSFIEWNVDCVHKFMGMFSFAVFDIIEEKALIFRDQLGIKPLYFFLNEGKFYYASEIKCFSAVADLKANYEKMSEYSLFGSIAGDQTLFKDVYQLLPGHYMRIDKNLNYQVIQYFDIKDSFHKNPLAYSSSKLEALLNNSILKHTVSDVGYGVQLSGGLDSCYVLAAAGLQREGLETFSIELQGYDVLNEGKYQRLCAEKFKTVHHPYSFSSMDFQQSLEESIWFFDYPLHHPNIVGMYILCAKTKERGIKVLLSGDGADEIFGGYRWYFENNKKMKDDIENIIYSSSYNSIENISGIFKGFSCELLERKAMIDGMDNQPSALLLLDQKLYLQKWFQRQDRMGMSASVEIRVPYCNVNVFEYLNNLSFDVKTNYSKDPKYLLKQIADKYLPKDVVWRKKIGFGIPLEDWFREDGSLMARLKYLQDDIFKERGIYDQEFVDALIQNHIENKSNNGRILWTLLNIELWHRIFIDKSISPLQKEGSAYAGR